MSDVMIIDDLVPKEIQDRIEHKFCKSNELNWFFHPTSCGEHDNPYWHYMKNPNVVEGPQFVHYMYDSKRGKTSDYLDDALSIVNLLKQKYDDVKFDLHRIKANLQLQTKDSQPDKFCGVHRDFDFDHMVFLYYVNDSDGDTFLFDDINGELKVKERISPKKGRIIVFDGSNLHASSIPTNSPYRCVFNIDMEVIPK